jgi:hypothetical protein
MAMRTASPWWFSLLFAGSLLLIFLGERAFGYLDPVRAVFTGAGALLALGVTSLRVYTVAASDGDRRRVERALLACHIGALLALGMYWLTTDTGRGLLGLGDLEADALERFNVPMTVLWAITMAVSLVPMLMIETSLGTARRTSFSFAGVRTSERAAEALEAFRVREMAASGLTIALAMSLLMVTCNIAEQRNVRRDLSYFKTSIPGESTIQIARSVGDPVRVLLFFPPVNPVTNEVRGYMQSLAAAGGRIKVEEHDRDLDKKLAQEYRVFEPGAIVLVHRDKFELVQLTVDPEKIQRSAARMQLRELDGKINAALLQVVRAPRKAYLVVGHGELSDEMGTWGGRPGSQTAQLINMLGSLNYEVQTLGISNGLGTEVPADADMVLLLAPSTPLTDEETLALDTYLANGGKMLIALDPDTAVGLGRLEQRLGVRVARAPITDDKNFFPVSRTLADRRIILTDQFSAHASTTTLSRGEAGGRAASQFQKILFLNTGSIENVDVPRETAPRRTFVIRSMRESFPDLNPNFTFDEGTEKRGQYALVAAIESREDEAEKQPRDPSLPADVKPKADPMRVMVFADADIFIDEHQARWPQHLGALALDALKWLGGEEHIAGEIESERDVAIVHTKGEDVLWFYATIVGAPLVVLAFGVWFGWWRKQRTQRRPA